MSRTRKLIILGVGIVIIGSLVYFSPNILSYVQQSQYTTLTLPLNQWVTYKQYSISYHYDIFNDQNELWVAPTGTEGSTETFTVNQNANYTAFNLEIKITDVHSDNIVISIKQTS